MHMGHTHTPDPRSLLPLTPIAFQVLLALSDRPRHGYGIIQEIDDRTDGLIRLRTGTLYVLLHRLAAEDLVETSRAPKGAGEPARTPGSPRRYYTLTAFGRAVLAAEARRLEAVVRDARSKHVLGRTSS